MTWLATISTKLKVWGLILLGYVAMGFSIVLLKKQKDRARSAAERYKAKAHHANTVAKKRNQNETEIRSRRAEARKEIDSGRGSPVFRNPGELFDDPDTDK